MKDLSLSKLLKDQQAFKRGERDDFKKETKKLQLKMLKIQQGIWHKRGRAIIVFEGFDASGKGGAIRKLTGVLDPRGVHVHPIGAPSPDEQNKHWLHRFWTRIPESGTIAIFDRSWYGRVLVERVERLTKKSNWQRGYSEINQFEKMLQDDGVDLIKIFLAITNEEQLTRFEDRLKDPYKQWKLSEDDLRSRKKWNEYVRAVDQMFLETSTKSSPWTVIAADHKAFARREVLKTVTSKLRLCEKWIEAEATRLGRRSLAQALKDIGKTKGDL